MTSSNIRDKFTLRLCQVTSTKVSLRSGKNRFRTRLMFHFSSVPLHPKLWRVHLPLQPQPVWFFLLLLSQNPSVPTALHPPELLRYWKAHRWLPQWFCSPFFSALLACCIRRRQSSDKILSTVSRELNLLEERQVALFITTMYAVFLHQLYEQDFWACVHVFSWRWRVYF